MYPMNSFVEKILTSELAQTKLRKEKRKKGGRRTILVFLHLAAPEKATQNDFSSAPLWFLPVYVYGHLVPIGENDGCVTQICTLYKKIQHLNEMRISHSFGASKKLQHHLKKTVP